METDNIVLAVDFDGTLNLKNVYPDTGKPNTVLIQRLITLRKSGAKIILYTCRTGINLAAAVEFCRMHGLEFDAVNENLPEHVEMFGGKDSRKINATYYIDDRAITPHNFVDQERADGWISVKDGLPTDSTPVLCITDKCNPFVARYDHKWARWRVSGTTDVTHWVPLPKPPKGAGE